MRIIKKLLLFSLLCVCVLLCACDSLYLKTPIDYGESKWVSGESEEIKIELFVSADKTAYSLVSYADVTKKYDNTFVSEMLYVNNVDDDGNLILKDEHITGFSAYIVDASDGAVSYEMDLTDFAVDFLGVNNGLKGQYSFILSIVS